jgi:NitT/TauT family transport system ATP-binding protein
LQDVTLEVGNEEFVTLIGPSGCGKTTLLKVLGDLLEPTMGSVTIQDRPPSELRRSKQVGFMFQDAVMLPWKTVGENVKLLCQLAARPISDEARDHLLELVGLAGNAERYPHELSGGMRQRAAIARALALDPLLLLMDEPFGALDEITRMRMNEELLRIWDERRKTVVFVTHSISEAAFLSDRVLVMGTNPGRIVADVPIDLPRPRTDEVRFSQEMTDKVADLHGLLQQGGSQEGPT